MSLRLTLAAVAVGLFFHSTWEGLFAAMAVYWFGSRLIEAIESNAQRILKVLREILLNLKAR